MRIVLLTPTTTEPATNGPVLVGIDRTLDNGDTTHGRFLVDDWRLPGQTVSIWVVNP